MKATRQEAFDAINGERDYQESLWPREVVHGTELSVGDFILLVEEYAAKARLAWSKQKYPETEALDNIRKIAGIAVRGMETHGVVLRK